MCVLGTDPRSVARAASALNSLAISPALGSLFFKHLLQTLEMKWDTGQTDSPFAELRPEGEQKEKKKKNRNKQSKCLLCLMSRDVFILIR